VNEYQQPRLNNDTKEINMMGQPLYLPTGMKSYDEYKDTTRAMCEKVLKHIRQVWCSGSKDQYEYVMNWLSHLIVGGKKQRTALFLKSVQGTGKGTIVEFLIRKVIGSNLAFSTQSTESITSFNS